MFSFYLFIYFYTNNITIVMFLIKQLYLNATKVFFSFANNLIVVKVFKKLYLNVIELSFFYIQLNNG